MNEEQYLIDSLFIMKLNDMLSLAKAEELFNSKQKKSQAEIEWAKQHGLKFAAEIWGNDNARI